VRSVTTARRLYRRRIVKLVVRPRAEGSGWPVPLGLTAAVCSLLLAGAGCGGSARASGGSAAPGARSGGRSAAAPRAVRSTYTLLQMNLCLSGLATCYRKVAYPAVLQEAVTRIRQTDPEAVTFNEACENDVALIARRTGYHLSFSTVIYGAGPLRCIRPRGRGVFGDAVLTKAAIESSDSQAFQAQTDIERRRWLCVTTRVGVDVCTAHLSERTPTEVAGNDGQCDELTALLKRRAAVRTVIFGGDLNRRSSCAPAGFWVRTDGLARQDPGLQQVYGAGALRSPSSQVVPAAHTDHDILLVRAQLALPVDTGIAPSALIEDQLGAAFSATNANLRTRPVRSQSLHSRWAVSSSSVARRPICAAMPSRSAANALINESAAA
jgi:endonuclease/exonuclease/phosphatase family metal-dependent hydrolase